MNYQEFLQSKEARQKYYGIEVNKDDIHSMLFEFQRDIVLWSLKKGRAAIFADTGLGKTFMQLEWARLIGGNVLIIAPLSVARQTVREAQKININVKYVRSQEQIQDGINITNYEMIEHFEFDTFHVVVLDESSILKSLTGKTRKMLTELCADIPYRLCCTATPAPNDIAEIANHAEFLGIMTREEMLAMFFVHDDNGYRLKGHAQIKFYQWLASWGVSVKKPSDIGDYSDDGYNLPPLNIEPIFVHTDYTPDGQLFSTGLSGITGRTAARKATINERVEKLAEIVRGNDKQWIIWCGLDDEQKEIEKLVPDCVSVYGRHSPDEKIQMIEAFQDGEYRVLITKAKIAGFGMNFQNASNMGFLGLSDSFETYYQCIRRCYRFWQTEPVNAYIVLSEIEDAIYQNVMRKEKEAKEMTDKLIENVMHHERQELRGETQETYEYTTDTASGEDWIMMLGDSAERMKELDDNNIDLSIYSPPFMSLYTYSPTARDLGNTTTEKQFFDQYSFIMRELLRITKPGRLTCVHVAQVPAMLVRDGYIGLKDFRGKTIQAYIDNGWIYHGEVCIDKDPQAQAIRTKAKSLLFTQMRKDSSWSRPALADYILFFRKPGENAVPIKTDIDNNTWIEWARPIWYGIKESDTLQYRSAKDNEDERHICPLQLGTIERCVRLWSNIGETILSPFAGIGSEGYEALKHGRKFIGIELKESYWKIGVKNLQNAVAENNTPALFDIDNFTT